MGRHCGVYDNHPLVDLPQAWIVIIGMRLLDTSRDMFQTNCTGLRTPKSGSLLTCGVMPFLTSRDMGYWRILTVSAPGLTST